MKIRPMIFNTEMINALLSGKKTVTRRPVKPQPTDSGNGYMWWPSNVFQTMVNIDKMKGDLCWDGVASDMCPIASVGDLIWVRETFQGPLFDVEKMPEYQENKTKFETPEYCIYAATDKKQEFYDMEDNLVCRWRPSIHMPRWASRITLKVTDVRMETIGDLRHNKEQVLREGFDNFPRFKHVWKSIYGDCRPDFYVWVIEFDVIKKNVDALTPIERV